MANLSQLKFAMGISIFLSAFIFSLLIFIIVYFLELDVFVGLALAIGGSGLFILFQYAIGPVIVEWTTHLNYLKPGENPWLENTVKELADKAGLPMPRLATVPNNTPNAFTFGRSTSGAVLAVHEGLLRQLNQAEIRAVIAHELGHIKHKDYIVMTVLSCLPLISYYIAQVTLFAGIFSGGGRSRSRRDKDNSGAILLVIGIIAYAIYIITFLIVMRLSRLREHFADAFSAYATSSPRSLASALAKITYGLSIAPKNDSSARSFYISDPAMAKQEIASILENKNKYDLDNDGVLDERELELAMEQEAASTWAQGGGLFSTHPATFRRILLLKEIEQEMNSGNYSSSEVYRHV
ncbi:MAG: M48 family metalloprotease [Methanocella sp.]